MFISPSLKRMRGRPYGTLSRMKRRVSNGGIVVPGK